MKAEINVTPLVDIVLVLLIIFIVITPAVHDAVRLPTARHGASPRPEPGAGYLTLILAAHRDPAGAVDGPGPVLVEGPGTLDAQGHPLSFALADAAGRRRLAGFIQESVAHLADRRVFIKADHALPFKYIDQLLQICREGGAVEASAVTREDREPGRSAS